MLTSTPVSKEILRKMWVISMDRAWIFMWALAGVTQGYSQCLNENGSWKLNFVYTRIEDCQEGVYYVCADDGTESRRICSQDGDAFNHQSRQCEPYSESLCQEPPICPTNHIAGPHPNGYECQEDCVEMGMCWDNRTSKCLCRDSQNCPKETPQLSKCPYRAAGEVTCNPAASLEVYPDIASCSHFYFCVFGVQYRFECPAGQYFEQRAPSYCELPENLSRPCVSRLRTR